MRYSTNIDSGFHRPSTSTGVTEREFRRVKLSKSHVYNPDTSLNNILQWHIYYLPFFKHNFLFPDGSKMHYFITRMLHQGLQVTTIVQIFAVRHIPQLN